MFVKLKNGWIVSGEIYNVREFFKKQLGEEACQAIPSDWYEYRVTLLGPKGEIIDEYDSLIESYNGFQTLSRDDASDSLKEIIEDCLKGKIENWFNVKNVWR